MSARPLQSVPSNQEEPEAPAKSSGGNGGSNVERRLTALETHVQYLATKEDIQKLKVDVQKLKVWFLQATISAMVVIVTVTVAILKIFF